MLNAVLAGKKRGTGLEGLRLRIGVAEGAEDVVTATVFERLAYLPDELFCAVFAELLDMPFGPLREISYWPSWYLSNGSRVEPDVFLGDDQQHLLVEAKRHDNTRQQCAEQLAAELEAGWRSGQLAENCILLTLGGFGELREHTRQSLYQDIAAALPVGRSFHFRLVCRSWQQLYVALENQLRRVALAQPGLQRLLTDIADCYSWHGLRTHRLRWLSGLSTQGSITVPPGAFDHWSLK
ncbi:hypothetical protein D3C84_546450 [compost metagenome]